jgi:hypothetical protein
VSGKRNSGWGNALLTPEQAKTAGIVLAIALVFAGLIAISLFALAVTPHLTVFACALGFAAASGAVGAIFGFIFGIPRTLTSDDGATDKGLRSRIVPNTNLEQVSDWLTKILIGATLVELKSIPSRRPACSEPLRPPSEVSHSVPRSVAQSSFTSALWVSSSAGSALVPTWVRCCVKQTTSLNS